MSSIAVSTLQLPKPIHFFFLLRRRWFDLHIYFSRGWIAKYWLSQQIFDTQLQIWFPKRRDRERNSEKFEGFWILRVVADFRGNFGRCCFEWVKASSTMLPRGSIRRVTGPRSAVRSRRGVTQSLGLNPSSSGKSLQNNGPSEFREAGMCKYTEICGVIPNGTTNNGTDIHVNTPNSEQQEEEYPTVASNVMAGGYSRTSGCVSGQSISMDSGSIGSPSRGNDAAIMTPASTNHTSRLQHIDAQDMDSPGNLGSTKKRKRGPRVTGGEKGGRGLRQFSMKVCEKVESKGRTTYNEVADELVGEFVNMDNSLVSPDRQQYDEKNIRRRVYDALNVLMAMDIISKDKKEIQWKGLPTTSVKDVDQLEAEKLHLQSKIEKKASYLQELEEQYIGLQNLVQRNECLYGSGNTPSRGVTLPFILVQTRPHATVEIEISEDMRVVHFDFESTPFSLRDDAYVLKEMGFCKNQCGTGALGTGHEDCCNGTSFDENKSVVPSTNEYLMPSRSPLQNIGGSYYMSSSPARKYSSPPVPGILKARVKHEHILQ
uniref:E2F/DP family winged-helix DNA-binding domain-containing protein n=1 Tax=Araucaria cunninghamii TaxID=56994 RepID=A0A0D6QZS2_ARACU